MESFPPYPIGPGQRALAAIVFTDVVSFSARMQVNEETTLALLQRDFTAMKKLCLQHSGSVLKSTGDGLLSFYQDLAAHNLDKKVLTMTFSEFGRRVSQNASNGTDHGTAMPLFIVGGGVKGGIYGEHPSLTDLDHGDLKFSTDFRAVYATVIEKWLGRNASDVITGSYPTLAFV